MKVKFSRQIEFIPVWMENEKLPPDQQFKVQVTPMEYADLLDTQEAFRPDAETGSADTKKVFGFAQSILPRYCIVTGLEDDNGPVSIVEIVKYPMFLDLCIEILLKLSNVSTPSKVDEKN